MKNKKETLKRTKGKVPILEVVLSVRYLSIMLKSSLPIVEALISLSDQVSNKRLKKIYFELKNEVQNGMSLASAMKFYPRVFPGIIVSIVDAGEQGGTLEKNLIYLADYLKKDYELKRKVKNAMFYPIIILGMTMIEGAGMMFLILPRLETLFSSFKNIPDFTKFLLSFSKFIRENVVFLGIGFTIFAFLWMWFFGTKIGKIIKDNVALKFPIFKVLNKNSILANFARTLGILLESGIPLSKALNISANTVTNHNYTRILLDIEQKTKEGQSLAMSLKSYEKFFPPTFIKMIQTAEQTGTLEDNLMYLHQFYADDVLEMSNNLAILIEPLLLIFVGAMIGLLAMAIVGPIYQLTSSINE